MLARSVKYRQLAESYATNENFYRAALSGEFRLGDPSYGPIFKDRLNYSRSMREKYRRAARYPWLPVEPDPPEPR